MRERKKNDIDIINIILFFITTCLLSSGLHYTCAKLFLVGCQDCTSIFFLTKHSSPFSHYIQELKLLYLDSDFSTVFL